MRKNDQSSLATFRQRVDLLPAGYHVLEIGTRRWGSKPTHHKDWLQRYGLWTMTDFMAGTDVDVVADAHDLTYVFGENSYDVIWASSVWEHLHSPWTAAESVLKVLKPGGLFFIQTHNTFPIHGYPNDYFRFTREGLESLFRNAKETVSSYEYPCEISDQFGIVDYSVKNNCYLNVSITGKK